MTDSTEIPTPISSTELPPDGGNSDDAELKRAFAARDEAKRKARELGQKLADMQSTIEELQSFREAQAEKEAQSRQEQEKARSKEESEAAKLRRELEDLKKAQLQAELTARKSAIADSMQERFPGLGKPVLKALLNQLEADGELLVPETIDADALDGASIALRKHFPEAFKGGNTQRTGAPGMNSKSKDSTGLPSEKHQKGYEKGQALSHGYLPKKKD